MRQDAPAVGVVRSAPFKRMRIADQIFLFEIGVPLFLQEAECRLVFNSLPTSHD
jgi:hypothetical protein